MDSLESHLRESIADVERAHGAYLQHLRGLKDDARELERLWVNLLCAESHRDELFGAAAAVWQAKSARHRLPSAAAF